MTELGATLKRLFLRELGALRRELEAYPDDAMLWTRFSGAPNVAGTLALHLTGNLQHFIGAVLGETGYERNRDREFEGAPRPRAELLAEVDAAARAVALALDGLTEDALEELYPVEVAGGHLRTGDFLLHLLAHLAYHLGQIDYHRRVVTGEPGNIGAVALAEMVD